MHVVFEHGLDQADRAGDVGAVVVERYVHRLPDHSWPRNDDGVNVMLDEYLIQRGLIANVHLIRCQIQARYLTDSSERRRGTIGVIVGHHDVITGRNSSRQVWLPMKPAPPVTSMAM